LSVIYNYVDYKLTGSRDSELTITAAGVRFHARRRGGRPRAVYLHGFAGDLHTWDALWTEPAAVLPGLRYDLRGFGRTRGGEEETFSHADDLLAVLDALDLEQVDLVGVSMGGGIALNFALDHPQRVDSLVLISPAIVAWEWSQQWRDLWRPLVELARAGHLDEARQRWWQHPLFATVRDSGAAASLHDAISRYSGSHWLRDSHRPMAPDVERLFRLQARTLLLTGELDLPDFRLIADLIAASVPELTRLDLPGCGHLLHLEQTATCARQIGHFLRGKTPAAD
jgi:pimeloyl-ACP methyl ester carboxylesterase